MIIFGGRNLQIVTYVKHAQIRVYTEYVYTEPEKVKVYTVLQF